MIQCMEFLCLNEHFECNTDKCVRMVLVFVGVVYLIFLFYRALICLDKCVRMVLVFVGVVYLIFLFYRALILPRCSQANDKVLNCANLNHLLKANYIWPKVWGSSSKRRETFTWVHSFPNDKF